MQSKLWLRKETAATTRTDPSESTTVLSNTATTSTAATTETLPSDRIFSRVAQRIRSTLLSSTPALNSTANSSTPVAHGTSVHLQLGSEAMMPQQQQQQQQQQPAASNNRISIFHYTDPVTQITWTGVNISRRRFEAWLNYVLGTDYDVRGNSLQIGNQVLESPLPSNIKDTLRSQWKQGRLLCDRTELLTVYNSENSRAVPRTTRHGSFRDLLHLYTDRYLSILKDEQEDTKEHLRSWLYHQYGVNETQRLIVSNFRQESPSEQRQILQHFLDFFRSSFPYYYDKCDHCGASYKHDDIPNNTAGDVDEHDEEGTFLGYVYPSPSELSGKAGRTELYQCYKCHGYTRFPRYNRASAVLSTHRGRCGEYSMLLVRMLRAVGHTSVKWVVDWADHVWAEIELQETCYTFGSRNRYWIHLDPCEAAVDLPHLYQGWGKQQTYIVGFDETGTIQDLTKNYTTDSWETIRSRREDSPEEIEAAIRDCSMNLKQQIESMMLLPKQEQEHVR